jgi:FtsH-binding integral membrane protein
LLSYNEDTIEKHSFIITLAKTFFITAATFGATSIYGYTTSRDLTSFGSFLVMGLLGLIIAGVVNIFMQSAALDFVLSILGVGIFIGLIAWDTQKIKSLYYSVGGGVIGEKMAISAAFNLYLDVINLFVYLLRFLGNRRN